MSFGTKSDGDVFTAAIANLYEAALGGGYPAQPADFLVFYDSVAAEYKARNCLDGTIDYSSTNAATVINNCFTAGRHVHCRGYSGIRYDLGTTSIVMDGHGMSLTGDGVDIYCTNGTSFEYSGTGSAIDVNGSGTRLEGNMLANFGVIASGSAITGANAYGVHMVDVEMINLYNIKCRDFEAGCGFNIAATATQYSALMQMFAPLTHECKLGIYIDGFDGSHECNCLYVYGGNFIGKSGPTAGGRGIQIGGFSTCNSFFATNVEIQEVGWDVYGDHNTFYQTRTESIGTTHLVMEAISNDNSFWKHTFVGLNTKISDGGTRNRWYDCGNYVTANWGSDSIANGTTSKVVAHGLDVTPLAEHFTITGKENPTNPVGTVWVDTIGATNFTVNVENDPGASNWDFGWNVRVY